MNNKQIQTNTSVGFFGFLQLLFIALKLIGYVDWAWAIVLIPLWINLAGILFFLIVFGVVAIIDHHRTGDDDDEL